MFRKESFNPLRFLFVFLALISFSAFILAQEEGKPLVLQEMTWTDVRDYLERCDMVIIPLGSTEQHGPHLPLGTDYYEALGMSKRISAQTGVVVAPVLWSGYSVYHSGFPGTLSLKPETMEQVLFETAEMLMKYGFRRFMFFNYHGGNSVVQQKVMHRINHSTEAIAVAIGAGSPIQRGQYQGEDEVGDEHAGIGETSLMLYLKPELVKMERAEKSTVTYNEKLQELWVLSRQYPDLLMVFNAQRGVPVETKKGGASHELYSNGIWSFSDPNKATKERGERQVIGMVSYAVKFIEAWRHAKK
ncbi:MAG: creatininase family protein [Candidatus Aminicenantes bacterium]|jgi:creatinine amidohydrolase/Fe(II)-dependent formamide hydrolase-like protein